MASDPRVGVVVIGRNEGARLVRCLDSVLASGVDEGAIVYADSGSVDGSPEEAKRRGIAVVQVTAPYTAAKGRNAGFERLRELRPAVEFVQFCDGDTEYFAPFIAKAAQTLASDRSVGAVTGHLLERHPSASVYNLLSSVEWAGETGDLEVFAGNVMIRVGALAAAGGYDPTLIAGEDPECAVRLRLATGLRIVRIDEPMCLHDIAMTHFAQWWTRCLRGGHACAEVNRRHGGAPLRFWAKEVRSNWVWGGALPGLAAALLPWTRGGSLALWGLGWLVLGLRIYRNARARGLAPKTAFVLAVFTTLGKLPTALGQLRYHVLLRQGRASRIIEYKRVTPL